MFHERLQLHHLKLLLSLVLLRITFHNTCQQLFRTYLCFKMTAFSYHVELSFNRQFPGNYIILKILDSNLISIYFVLKGYIYIYISILCLVLIYISIHLSIHIFPSIHPSIHPSIYLSIYLSNYTSGAALYYDIYIYKYKLAVIYIYIDI